MEDQIRSTALKDSSFLYSYHTLLFFIHVKGKRGTWEREADPEVWLSMQDGRNWVDLGTKLWVEKGAKWPLQVG